MVIGHRKIREILKGQIEFGRVSHAYLFYGPEGIGKKLVALEFAKALLCLRINGGSACQECDSCRHFRDGNASARFGINHPDFKMIAPAEEASDTARRIKEIGVPVIREILGSVNFKPLRPDGRRAVIIDDAHLLTDQAQNAFLKSLEEAPEGTVFILIIQDPKSILETVSSRCQKIKFSPLNYEEFRSAMADFMNKQIGGEERLKEYYSLSAGRLSIAAGYIMPSGQKRLDQIREDFLGFFKNNVWRRFQISESLAKDEPLVFEAVNLWQTLVRDMIIAKNLDREMVINKSFRDKIANESQSHGTFKLLKLYKDLARFNLRLRSSNFNSRLALDSILMEL